jgi:hypothetical protein
MLRDAGFMMLGYFLAAVLAPWLRRQEWFVAMTTRMAHAIDRITGFEGK